MPHSTATDAAASVARSAPGIRVILLVGLLPPSLCGVIAAFSGGGFGEVATSVCLAELSSGMALASTWGILAHPGDRRVVRVALVLVAFAILAGCYVYGRVSGIPTDDIHAGMGVVLLGMAMAICASTLLPVARGTRRLL